MANSWFRVWNDMVNDPKWRTIAKRSGQTIGDVISVYLHMLTCASNANERGRTQGWCDEDVANALDINIEQVELIKAAMQGRVLDGDYLTGWGKRQPIKEDGSAERARAWREAKKTEKELERTKANESERKKTQDSDSDSDSDNKNKEKVEKEKPETQRASRLPADWVPSESDVEFCKTYRTDLNPCDVADRFRDYWVAQPGAKGRKADWPATWRNWVRNEKPQARASPLSKFEQQKEFIAELTGNRHGQRTQSADIIDLN